MTIPYDIGPDCHPSGRPFRNVFPRTNAWRYLDWTVSTEDGYRLVIEGGAIAGLAYDEWPFPWGDPRYDLYEPVTVACADGREVWTREDWIDEVSEFADAPPEQDASVAAMISAVADGYPADADEKAVIGYALITDALERGATWAQIGAAMGISGQQAKRRAHKLREQVKRKAVRDG